MRGGTGIVVAAVVLSLTGAPPALSATITVTSLADTTAAGTLRSAIAAANAAPDADTIQFSVAGTVTLGSALPPLTNPAFIDGTTAPGFAGTPVVTLDGVTGTIDCLIVSNPKGPSTLRALEVTNCLRAVRFTGKGGHSTLSRSFVHGNQIDVRVEDSPGNIIGDSLVNPNVLIDSTTAIVISGKKAKETVVLGNHVGVNAAGNTAVANDVGLDIASPKTIVQANLISGNSVRAVRFAPEAKGSVLTGNYIGTNAAGSSAIANHRGVIVEAPAVQVFGNLISGNDLEGLRLASTKAFVDENRIGTDVSGLAALGNGTSGIVTDGVGGKVGKNTITGNLLSGNGGDGLFLGEGPGNIVQGNYIGADAFGSSALPNGDNGIDVGTATGKQQIGGDRLAGEGNLISGNAGAGIGTGAMGTVVQGNLIGTDETGMAALPNDTGINLPNGFALIGGKKPELGNVVSGNTNSGIAITTGTVGTKVYNNLVGTGLDGAADLGNGTVGIGTSANETIIGRFGSRNIVSWNLVGIWVTGDFNIVQGNAVGHDIHAQNAPNSLGIVVSGDFNRIGGTKPGDGNIVEDNTNAGITVTAGQGNSLLRNLIDGNGGLGIDLGPAGVTTNDSDDPDTGPNGLQNFPMLTSATVADGVDTIAGTLNSTPERLFRIEIFVSINCDGSGHGEGDNFIGAIKVKTNVSGDVSFSKSFPDSPEPGSKFSATATDLVTGDTSEFGNCI